MADETQTQMFSNTINNASLFPVSSGAPAQNPYGNMSSRTVEKVVQKEDPLGK